jgi:hypothetical protein
LNFETYFRTSYYDTRQQKMTSNPNAPKPQFLEHACDSTRILSKKRELYDIKERVAIEKENFERKSLILQQKEDELTTRDLDFQSKVRDLHHYSVH